MIRYAQVTDAAAILAIYKPYVENTAITFETEIPTVADFEGRIAATLKHYPYLVLEEEGQILGYAYASRYRTRAAYDWVVELSIYMDMNARDQGKGRFLYEALEKLLRVQGVLTAYACITGADEQEAYVTGASPKFHEALGYQYICHFPKIGYKFGQWFDILWMYKELAPLANPPQTLKSMDQLRTYGLANLIEGDKDGLSY